ncbi:MAG: S8 family serine peptidase [Phycisphaerales bacterium]|nr:S8 family serine peptidase [Phycisphaerales bacterium]
MIAIAGNDQSGQNGPIDNGLGLRPYTITVGGCDLEGQWVHPFSRRNPLPSEYTGFNSCLEEAEYGEIQYTPDGRIKALSVVAPIEGLFSTWAYARDIECDAGDPNDPSDDTPGYRMTTSPGTSLAAGQIAGIAALLFKVRRDLTPAQVKSSTS